MPLYYLHKLNTITTSIKYCRNTLLKHIENVQTHLLSTYVDSDINWQDALCIPQATPTFIFNTCQIGISKSATEELVLCKINDAVGHGVFANNTIKEDTRLCFYAGVILLPAKQFAHCAYALDFSEQRELQALMIEASYIRNWGGFFQDLPTSEELEQEYFCKIPLKKIATANVGCESVSIKNPKAENAAQAFSAKDYPPIPPPMLDLILASQHQVLHLITTTKRIKPKEQLGFSYGLSYWQVRMRHRCLFDKAGQPIPYDQYFRKLVTIRPFIDTDGADILPETEALFHKFIPYTYNLFSNSVLTTLETNLLSLLEYYALNFPIQTARDTRLQTLLTAIRKHLDVFTAEQDWTIKHCHTFYQLLFKELYPQPQPTAEDFADHFPVHNAAIVWLVLEIIFPLYLLGLCEMHVQLQKVMFLEQKLRANMIFAHKLRVILFCFYNARPTEIMWEYCQIPIIKNTLNVFSAKLKHYLTNNPQLKKAPLYKQLWKFVSATDINTPRRLEAIGLTKQHIKASIEIYLQVPSGSTCIIS